MVDRNFKKVIFFALVLSLVSAIAIAGSRGSFVLKPGDELYVCDCGEKCPCDSMSNNPGQCTCGKDLVKAKVTRVEKEKAFFKAEGWAKERTFKTVGKYTCACPPACKCDTISQNPGKCTCGVEMKKL
mgnify:CR=1 FL=1